MKEKIKEILKLKTIYLNLRYHRNISGAKKILALGKVSAKVDKTAKIHLNGYLRIGKNSFNNNRDVILRMEKGSKLTVNGNCQLYYGNDIVLFKDAELIIGNSFINSDAKIRCHKKITIGDNCAISHDVTIMDSDAHYLNGDKHTNPITINNNVWIGTRVTILNGVTIGEGAVIAANSLVNKDVPPHTLVAGVPAKVIKENVSWEH